jgi:hypothetical protein
MSLYPLKITEITQDCKIQNLKKSLEKTFDIALNEQSSLNLKELKSQTFQLYSECMVAYEKEKMRCKDLRFQFDQIQQEAASEFNARQKDFVKQIDLFEAEIKKLRQENRSLYGQVDLFFHSCETFQRTCKGLLDDLQKFAKADCPSSKGVNMKVFELQELVQKYSQDNNLNFGLENEITLGDLETVQTKTCDLDFDQRFYIKSPRKSEENRFSRTPERLSYDLNPVRLIDANRVMFISDQEPKRDFQLRDSISSLNTFLEDTYRKTAPCEKWHSKENISPLQMHKLEKPVEIERPIRKEYIETFRTGSEMQLEGEDSFMTITESPGENMSSIFPALEESPTYKHRHKF